MPAFQVTLTSADTNYHLLTLVRAIDSAYVDVGDIVVQADDDGGTQEFKLGDADLSATRYGQLMSPGDFSPHVTQLYGLYARCDEASKTLNILIARG
jgi:hypothetical protein